MSVRCLVAGGGIGGLAFAAALDPRRAAVVVVEKTARFAPVGAGIVLHPNGIAAVEHLGIAGEVSALGTVLHAIEIVRETETTLVPFARVWEGAAHPTIALHRADLHEALLAAAQRRQAHLQVRMGETIRAIEPHAGRFTVRFNDGREDGFDVIVGADGVESGVRRFLFGGAAAEELGLYYCRFAAAADQPDEVWRTFERQSCTFGFIPIGNGLMHCFVQSTAPLPENVDAIAAIDPLLNAAIERRVGPAHWGGAKHVWPHRWRSGRCVLLGDAAHALSPTFSEGGSLAIEDAVVLGRALSEFPVDEALERYEAVRAPRLAQVARMATSQARNVRSRPRVDSAAATEFLRQMYRPLLNDILTGLQIPARAFA